jgi:hypothetical protein
MNQALFADLEFSDLKLDDGRFLSDYLRRHPQPLTGYTFSTLAAWHPYFRYQWLLAEPDALLISCVLDPDPHPHLLQPVGTLTPLTAERILAAAAGLDYPLKIVGVSGRFLEDNFVFSQSFMVQEDRAVSNYLYSASALANLSGRKYSKKRNLLAQASGLYKWSVQEIAGKQIASCFDVLEAILSEENPRMEGMLKRELAALEYTLRHFDDFGQRGVLISVESRPVAFSIYEEINPGTMAVHFERALRSYKGLFQVINWETAKIAVSQGFEFINREEDLGDTGLRDAKMSYHPIEIIPAYEMVYKGPICSK